MKKQKMKYVLSPEGFDSRDKRFKKYIESGSKRELIEKIKAYYEFLKRYTFKKIFAIEIFEDELPHIDHYYGVYFFKRTPAPGSCKGFYLKEELGKRKKREML